MTLTELRYIVAVAQERHFGRAAQRCHVSQPTLSIAIKKLEEELALSLFDRSSNEVITTEAGGRIVAQARRVLDEADVIRQLASEEQNELDGAFKLGLIFTVAPYLLPKLILSLREIAPNMPLMLEENYTHMLTESLKRGDLDAIIVAEPFNALAEAKGVGKILRFSGDIWRDHACCLSMMHDHDIQSRPEWVQNVINALVDAAAFAKHRRAETAELLAKQGIRHYTPHDAKVLRAVLQPEPIVWQKYERTGAIRHADWQQRRVDFQPFPFQSYSELLVKLLKETHLAGVNTFLNDVQPEKAARELFDTRFVERALQRDGLMSSFGLQSLQRQKTFAL